MRMIVIKRITVVVLAILAVNFICFFYYNPLHGSDLNSYRLEPNTTGLQAVEGFGIMYSDENGFSNVDKPLIDNGYVLVMGSSQSKGDQVSVNKRYSDLLNGYLGFQNELGVYNMAYNGGKFCDIIRNFKQLVTEFPNSKVVIIEVTDSQLAINEEIYLNAMSQVDINESIYGEELSDHDIVGNVKVLIKKYCPLLLLYVNQYIQWNEMAQVSNIEKGVAILAKEANVEEKKQWFSDMLNLIKTEYENEIIVVYHNGFYLNENNEMEDGLSEVGADFFAACEENEIAVLNMTPVFKKHFETEREIPYGFWNTSMGKGHLNKTGHELVAKELFRCLEEKQ